jgi:hypothetical protein
MKMRKKKLTNLFKSGILLFGISLTLWNCEKEGIIVPEETQNEKISVNSITLEQLEKTKGFEKEFINLSKV